MPTANADRLIKFYKRLGFAINAEDCERWLTEVGVEIIGPGHSLGRPATILYARDPDDNLLERMVYLEG